LGFDADAELHNFVRSPTGDIVPSNKNTAVAVVDLVQTGHAFEQGAFSCPVGTDQATQFTLAQIEVDIIEKID
jgi:hypothetical protein